VIRSDNLRPAFADGLPLVTLATSAPVGRFSPSVSAISGVTACRRAPSHGRFTALAAALGGGDDDAHHVGGNGEADALRAAGAREDRGVDADQLAGHVDQRAAGIAGIDRRVGLDEELIVGDADLRARQRRDDAVVTVWPTPNGLPMASTTSPTSSIVGIGEVERREFLAHP
jgi:hypothetical protein